MNHARKPVIFVGADGNLRFIYADELADLLTLGPHEIARASTVEPSPSGWQANLAPSNGPILGPFPYRRDAINAEVAWLTGHPKNMEVLV